MMNRDQALEYLKTYIKSDSMIRHSLASEAVMRAAAQRLNEDPERWGLAGLLHDVDVEVTNANPETHAVVGAEMLAKQGFDEEFIEAIRRHNEEASVAKRETKFQFALAACETITGLVTATTLVYPDKKLAGVKTKSILKRMKAKSFAASVNRDTIMECERIGIPLPEFAELAIDAMKTISVELGL